MDSPRWGIRSHFFPFFLLLLLLFNSAIHPRIKGHGSENQLDVVWGPSMSIHCLVLGNSFNFSKLPQKPIIIILSPKLLPRLRDEAIICSIGSNVLTPRTHSQLEGTSICIDTSSGYPWWKRGEVNPWESGTCSKESTEQESKRLHLVMALWGHSQVQSTLQQQAESLST